ncbi:MAG: putative baseplate assembly protein [Desulfuromonadaceae bacterium]
MKTNPIDPSLRDLNDCGCGAGTTVETPADVANRPCLSALSFRSGTHAQFKASLIAGLSNDRRPQLGNLRTRDDDDFTMALLDGFAAMADVLTFYSERIANEGFLRTATERRSVLELARAIGYELRPGVAAGTWLAFTVEEAPGSPGYANFPKGTKVQSVPGPDERPQVYETVEALQARKEWNELRALSHVIAKPYFNQKKIRLAGTTTHLKPGDPLLIIGDEWTESSVHKNGDFSENWDFRLVKAVELLPDPDPARAATVVTLNRGLGKKSGDRFIMPAHKNARVYALRKRANIFGYNAPDRRILPPGQGELRIKVEAGKSDVEDWPDYNIFCGDGVDLDSVYSSVMKGDWVVVSDGSYEEVFTVVEVAESGRSDFLVAGKITQLKLLGERDNLDSKRVREATVYCDMQELPRAASPVECPVQGSNVTLDRYVEGLLPGKRLVVSGRHPRLRVRSRMSQPGEKFAGITPEAGSSPARLLEAGEEFEILAAPTGWTHRNISALWKLCDRTGVAGYVSAPVNSFEILPSCLRDESFVEVVTIKSVHSDPAHTRTTLEFTGPLENVYDPASVLILANVAPATHGESVVEIVGSGDANQAHQHFLLKQAPLTYTSAETPTGPESSLKLFVNDVKWDEVDSLYGRKPRDRVFITRCSDDGTTNLTFGDGWLGTLLPTGQENIRAHYRKGLGSEGNVKADQLKLLMTRPLGAKAVTNPVASSGAQDPEKLADARRNAPLQTLTLGRIVSLQDYEDFARSFSGIAKAHAVWVWTAGGRGVFVTVALPGGARPISTDMTLNKLRKALHDFGNPLVPVYVVPGTVTTFSLGGEVIARTDRIPERVKSGVDMVLRNYFSFDARQFGRNVALSEVVALIQNAPGVEYVRLTRLTKSEQAGSSQNRTETILRAACPRAGAAMESIKTQSAEILVLDDASLTNLKVKSQ